MVGNVAVSSRGISNERTLVLQDDASVTAYRELAERIRRNGSLAGIQLAYCPSSLKPTRKWVVQDRELELARLQDLVASLSATDIHENLKAFYISVRLACEASYEAIQIHCAHGYFLSLLLDPRTNRRNDDYRANGEWMETFFREIRQLTLWSTAQYSAKRLRQPLGSRLGISRNDSGGQATQHHWSRYY
jgi:2,4-dienoyl-CoA reductase-like NADH-dependent reductase (Old Yellow Enzyme family)